MGQLDPHRRERLLAHLAEHFTQGATPKRLELYVKQLKRESPRFYFEHVREAIERIIITREQATLPPYAVLRRTCTEVRTEMLRVREGRDQADERDPPPVIKTPEDQEAWNKLIHDERVKGDEVAAEERLLRKYRREAQPDRSRLTRLGDTMNDEVPF